jgi:hypothetical protein
MEEQWSKTDADKDEVTTSRIQKAQPTAELAPSGCCGRKRSAVLQPLPANMSQEDL